MEAYQQTDFKSTRPPNLKLKQLPESSIQDSSTKYQTYAGVRVCREICIETIIMSSGKKHKGVVLWIIVILAKVLRLKAMLH